MEHHAIGEKQRTTGKEAIRISLHKASNVKFIVPRPGNVRVATNVRRANPQVVITLQKSQIIQIDILVLATGFDAVSGSMRKLDPKGRNGLALAEKWEERFDTYLGSTIAGFPNLFMIHGPGSPGVFFQMPMGGELTTAWIAQCIEHMRAEGLGSIEATEAAEASWDEEIRAISDRTLYPRTNSWYMGANVPGKPRQFLGHLMGSQYFDRLAEVASEGFEGFSFEPAKG